MLPMIEINHHRCGGGQHRVARCFATACTSARKARAPSRPRRVGRGRIRADRCRREHRAGRLHPDRFLGGQMKLDLEAARRAIVDRGRVAARPEPRGGGGRNHPHRQCEHGARGPGQLRGEGIRPPRHHPRRVRGRRPLHGGGPRQRRRHSGRTGAAAAGGVSPPSDW